MPTVLEDEEDGYVEHVTSARTGNDSLDSTARLDTVIEHINTRWITGKERDAQRSKSASTKGEDSPHYAPPRNLLLPSATDPQVFAVKCKVF